MRPAIIAVVIDHISQNEQQLLANLLRASGRDPASFSVTVQPDGLVRVSGPRGTAFYPREQWFTRFSRHLDKSFFDPEVPPPSGPRLPRRRGAGQLAGAA
jgi:hypothetical protein